MIPLTNKEIKSYEKQKVCQKVRDRCQYTGKFRGDAHSECNLRFIDRCWFMSTSLSNLVDNLSGIYDKECKKCMERKNN